MSFDEKTSLLSNNINRNYSINVDDSYNLSPDDPYAPRYDFSDIDDDNNNDDEIKNEKMSSHFEPHARKPFIPPSDSAMAYRMRYYNKLAAGSEDPEEKTTLQLPAHVIPSSLFFPSLKSILGLGNEEEDDDEDTEKGKQSDIKLIFSIWNTMMGSSLLALPWGFQEAGFASALALIFSIGAFCAYTATLIVRHGKDSADFFYLCNDYLGKFGKILCWISSIAILIGGVIAYDILMSDILYSSVSSSVAVIRNIAGDDSETTPGYSKYWNSYVTPVIVFIFMYPICNMKNFGIIVTINSLGVISIMYTVVFIFFQSTFQQGLVFTDVPQIKSDLFVLAGLLSISFYIHGMILPIIKSAKHPDHSVRNVVIGFSLVGISYSIVGAVGYLAYWTLGDIPQEFLQIYETIGDNTNIGVIVANYLLLFQLATVFPLLLLIIRIQVYGLLMNSQYPGRIYVWGLNLVLIAIGTFFALFFPNFGTVLSITGAVFGTIIVFFLPILVHLKAMKQKTGSWGIFRMPIHIAILIFSVTIAIGQFIPFDKF